MCQQLGEDHCFLHNYLVMKQVGKHKIAAGMDKLKGEGSWLGFKAEKQCSTASSVSPSVRAARR